jgi:hypothetical protein
MAALSLQRASMPQRDVTADIATSDELPRYAKSWFTSEDCNWKIRCRRAHAH